MNSDSAIMSNDISLIFIKLMLHHHVHPQFKRLLGWVTTVDTMLSWLCRNLSCEILSNEAVLPTQNSSPVTSMTLCCFHKTAPFMIFLCFLCGPLCTQSSQAMGHSLGNFSIWNQRQQKATLGNQNYSPHQFLSSCGVITEYGDKIDQMNDKLYNHCCRANNHFDIISWCDNFSNLANFMLQGDSFRAVLLIIQESNTDSIKYWWNRTSYWC